MTTEFGPHGGPWIATDDGFVEASVYETGVPPHFRLYFYDAGKNLRSPVAGVVTAETKRPGGTTQVFSFLRDTNFLKSMSDIPEPHEFVLRLSLQRDGKTLSYETPFTEEGHSHGGQDYHDHGHHGHSHHGGRWRRLFGHSHDIADKVDASLESNERGIRALKISLVGLGFTALFQLIIVILSQSVGLMADTIHNFADAGTSIPLWIAFALARRPANRRFTYGYGKVEDVAGVAIVLIIFFSACVAAYESAIKLIHPQPMQYLGWTAIAAVIGFLGNEAVAVFRIRVGKEIGSAALVADGQHARVDGFTSLAVLIGVIGTRLGWPLLDPLVGIAITIAILFVVKDAARSVWFRLIDGIEPEILEQIERVPVGVEGVLLVEDVRARWVGHRVHAEASIAVSPKLSVAEGHTLAKDVRRQLMRQVPVLSSVIIHVDPMDESGIVHHDVAAVAGR